MGKQFPFPIQEQEEGKEEQEKKEQGKEQEGEEEDEGAEVLDRLEGSTGFFQLREVGRANPLEGGDDNFSLNLPHWADSVIELLCPPPKKKNNVGPLQKKF